MSGDLPGAVLFACTQNAIRSPMAAGLMKHYYGHRVFVASCGLKPTEIDPFMVTVMDELGIDLHRHKPQGFDDLEDLSFDLVISLSPEAHHRALELTRTVGTEAEYWPTLDPSLVIGNREQMMEAYRDARDALYQRLRQRFGSLGARGV